MRFLAAGMQAFVLQYSTDPSKYPCALLELAAAVAVIRENSEAWSVDPGKDLYLRIFRRRPSGGVPGNPVERIFYRPGSGLR